MKNRISLLQTLLKQKGYYTGNIDGLMGPNTLAGISRLDGINSSWSEKRKIIGALQLLAKESGIDSGTIDGYWGPTTAEAFSQLKHLVEQGRKPALWRPEDLVDVNPNNWPKQYTPEFDEFYGKPGENLVRIQFPYPHKLSWAPYSVVNSTSCHKKVKESLEKVLENVLDHYTLDEIKRLKLDSFGGCFNKRKIRGGNRWSMHSWAIALDFDTTRNALKWGRDKASLAKPEYNKWWELWEEEGWVSLGRQRNFDWMHVQAAKI